MKISRLPVGTKLMWDAPAIGEFYNGGKRIVYPAIVIEIHGLNPNGRSPQNGWVKVRTGKNNDSWMGPDENNLRLPTDAELQTLTWPDV